MLVKFLGKVKTVKGFIWIPLLQERKKEILSISYLWGELETDEWLLRLVNLWKSSTFSGKLSI